LRGGIVVSPAASAFFAIRDGNNEVRGVTVDLMRAFAEALKLPLALQIYDNSGQVTDAVAAGACDVAFMPQDAERARRVDFGPAYYFISSTYLVPPAPPFKASRRSTGRACASSPFPTPRPRAVRSAPRRMRQSRKCRASIR
jgi:polar amino acid transport system substrate-binding protein